MDRVWNKITKKAVKWLKEAAEENYADAQYLLGCCYENGYGVEENLNTAFKWYQLSADRGNDDAQNSLGICYEDGLGTTKNLSKAIEWYEKSAAQDNKYAHYNIARNIHTHLNTNIIFTKSFATGIGKGLIASTATGVATAAGLAINPILGVAAIVGGYKATRKVQDTAQDKSYNKQMKQLLQTPDAQKMLKHYKAAADLGHKAAKEKYEALIGYLNED